MATLLGVADRADEDVLQRRLDLLHCHRREAHALEMARKCLRDLRMGDHGMEVAAEQGRVEHAGQYLEVFEGAGGVAALDFEHRTGGEDRFEPGDGIEREEFPGVHQSHPVAALGLVQVVGRDKDGDAFRREVVDEVPE